MDNRPQHCSPEPRKLSYQLLKTITDGFSDEQKLGSGAFGSVYKGVHENGEVIAVKVLRNVLDFDHKQFQNELRNLALLHHPNVVRLVGYCNEIEEALAYYQGKQIIAHEVHLALCMEYVDNGSLSKHISDEHHRELNWHICYKIIKGICEGLNYLCYGLESPIWHLDLKPDNILLDKNMVPKIADFGLSRLFGEEKTLITKSFVGTCGYLPPEYIHLQLISKEFDIYSLGVIITKIMVGSEGYKSICDMTQERLAEHVQNNWRKRLEEFSLRSVEVLCQQVKTCIEIALKCLNPQRHERPSIHEIISELKKTEMIGDLAVQPEQVIKIWNNGCRKNDFPENKLLEFIHEKGEFKWRAANNHNITIFTLDDILKITQNYAVRIGKAAFGEVYRGVLADGSLVAVKRYRHDHDFKEGFAKEVTVHSQINHKNVVNLLGYCAEENALMIVTEFMCNGNLYDLLHGCDDPIGLDARLNIAIDCAEALSYMHSSMYVPIIHGDIKPSNILLNDQLSAKLSDFGIARLLSTGRPEYTMNVIGSVFYLDPHFMYTGRIDPKNDVYSFGVVLIELITRKKMSAREGTNNNLIADFVESFGKGKKAREMFDKEILTNVDMKILVEFGKLAVDCIGLDIEKRPEMKDVLQCLQMLTKVYHQQGKEHIGRWFIRGRKKVGRERTMYYGSNSTLAYKLGSLDMFSRAANRNSIRNNFPVTFAIFTKEELEKILESSILIEKGVFCEVYKGYLGAGNLSPVAVKRCINGCSEEKDRYANEILIQSQVIHKSILKLIGCCLEVDDVPILVYEFTAGGCLDDILHGSNRISLNLDRRLQIAAESSRGIAYMHSEITVQILHLDIKPANILLTDDFGVKISGFGLSRMIDGYEDYTNFNVDDITYMDPVYARTGHLTDKSDVYSFGVVLLELITRKKASSPSNNGLINNFLEAYTRDKRVIELVDPEIAAVEDSELLDGLATVIKQCLDLDVDQRPEMACVAERLREMLKRSRANKINSEVLGVDPH